MIKGEDKYCDWCGKYCGEAGVNTLLHQFCSERCKRAYDNAKGTVDGGYRQGSIGHKIHKVGNTIENIIKTILYIVFGGAILLMIIAKLIK